MKILKRLLSGLTAAVIILGTPSVFAAKNQGYKFPVPEYSRISQYYSSSHSAIDIAANVGTAVYATKSGTIIKKYTGCNNFSRGNGKCSGGGVCSPNHGYSTASGSAGYCNDGFGNGYIIKHDDGTWAEYAHMNYLSDALYEGGYVTQGTYLGGVSSTGVSTGPHLHFGLRSGADAASFWKATPFNPLDYMDTDDGGSGSSAPSSSSVSVTTTNAQNVSETNATVYGTVSYSGSRPSEVGIYFGASSDNMSKVARDSINHSKNPFDMWYDLNSEAGQYLSAGTTYYWQCYAIVDGNETKGEVKSFTTGGVQSGSSSVSVTTTNAQNVSETNATVYGNVSYSGSRPSEVGIYFGTSSDNMSKVARDSINHSKNPFDMWYDLNSEAGQYLSAGTTYYWQCYAIVDGNETKGEVKSFTTTGTAPAPEPTPAPTPEPTPVPTPKPTPTPETPQITKDDDVYDSPSVLTVFSGRIIQIAVGDKMVNFPDAQPFIDSSSRTQVPIRAISEMLNCKVDWMDKTKTAIVTRDDGKTVSITVGSDVIIIGSKKQTMDTEAVIIDGRTYVPVRYVAEALGLTVEWE